MITEENNDLKEKVSRQKLKKILIKQYIGGFICAILFCVITSLFKFFFCYIFRNLEGMDLVINIIAGIFYLLIFIYAVKQVVYMIKIKTDKFCIVKDTLVDKQPRQGRRSRTLFQGPFFLPYRFYFAKFGEWSIPRYNYEWSEFYGPMKEDAVYEQAEITDSFYIVYVNRKNGFYVLSTKLFDLEGIINQH